MGIQAQAKAGRRLGQGGAATCVESECLSATATWISTILVHSAVFVADNDGGVHCCRAIDEKVKASSKIKKSAGPSKVPDWMLTC